MKGGVLYLLIEACSFSQLKLVTHSFCNFLRVAIDIPVDMVVFKLSLAAGTSAAGKRVSFARLIMRWAL